MSEQEQRGPERKGKVVLFRDALWREFRRNLITYSIYNTAIAAVVASLISGRTRVRQGILLFGLGTGIGYACKRYSEDAQPYDTTKVYRNRPREETVKLDD